MKRASDARIKTAVLAHRDGVLEDSEKELTKEDAEQVRNAINLVGYEATIDRVLKNAQPLGVVPADTNEKFLVADFTVGGTRTRVYLLNAGNCFQGFGGTSTGLIVRKTASLVVRTESIAGCEDTEYDVADKQAWNRIFHRANMAGYAKQS